MEELKKQLEKLRIYTLMEEERVLRQKNLELEEAEKEKTKKRSWSNGIVGQPLFGHGT